MTEPIGATRVGKTSYDNTKLAEWAKVPLELVPYVAAWSTETELLIRRCSTASNRPALCRKQSRGQGVPLLGKMDEFRQRRCWSERLCQVCGREISTKWIGIDSPQSATIPGQICPAPVLLEPLACVPCAKTAIEHCPGIARQREAGTLRCYVVGHCQLIQQIVGPMGNNDKLDRVLAEWKGEPPVGYLKAVLKSYTEVTVEDVLDM